MTETRIVEIPASLADKRLDQALASLCPDWSRNRLQQWIAAGRIQVDGRPIDSPKHKLLGGERVEIVPDVLPGLEVHDPEAMTLDIVYEDDALIVIDKPAGLVVHPGAGNWTGTLLNGLLHHCPHARDIPRAGIVHRLDKDTSGLMVVAKTFAAYSVLVRELQVRRIERIYQAVASGVFAQASGQVDAPIGRHPQQRTRMAVVPTGGKPAVTHWRVLHQFPGAAWIECRLETGRTHQIRVHMRQIGHPLIGDPLYGNARHMGVPVFRRQALHAWRLGLNHPVSGKPWQWQCDPPADFRYLLDQLRISEKTPE